MNHLEILAINKDNVSASETREKYWIIGICNKRTYKPAFDKRKGKERKGKERKGTLFKCLLDLALEHLLGTL